MGTGIGRKEEMGWVKCEDWDACSSPGLAAGFFSSTRGLLGDGRSCSGARGRVLQVLSVSEEQGPSYK